MMTLRVNSGSLPGDTALRNTRIFAAGDIHELINSLAACPANKRPLLGATVSVIFTRTNSTILMANKQSRNKSRSPLFYFTKRKHVTNQMAVSTSHKNSSKKQRPDTRGDNQNCDKRARKIDRETSPTSLHVNQ